MQFEMEGIVFLYYFVFELTLIISQLIYILIYTNIWINIELAKLKLTF